MNGTADEHENDSNWDLLASELGLEPSSTPPAAPKTSREPVQKQPEFSQPSPKEPIVEKVHAKQPEPEEAWPEPPIEEATEIIASFEAAGATVLEDTVLEEGPELDDIEPDSGEGAFPAEAGAASEGTGRKRRRRRRRKKGSGEPAGNLAPASNVAGDLEEEIVAEPVAQGESDAADDSLVDVVGEEAPEPVDDEDEEEEDVTPHAAIEELEEESTEPLPEWKVMAWTDLLATLYRPQDR